MKINTVSKHWLPLLAIWKIYNHYLEKPKDLTSFFPKMAKKKKPIKSNLKTKSNGKTSSICYMTIIVN